jgi:hypothetical protein
VDAEAPFFQSRELRWAAATVALLAFAAAAALGAVGRYSDRLLLDLWLWQPSGSPAAVAAFAAAQSPIPEQRPLRLTLQLPDPVQPGDWIAAERSFARPDAGAYCLRFFTFADPAATGSSRVRVLANDSEADSWPVGATAAGKVAHLSGLRPRDGRLRLKLELRAEAAAATPKVYFEFLSLRRCG